MNQIFVLNRWQKLVALHWVENRKPYLLAILAIAGLLSAWYSFLLVMDNGAPIDTVYQLASYYYGVFFIGCLFASQVFSDLGVPAKGIRYLAIPASHLEKLLCALLFAVVLFFLVFTAVFYLVDIPFVHLANKVIAGAHRRWQTGEPIPVIPVYNVFTAEGAPIPEMRYHIFLLGYFAIQSAFITGSVWFERYSFIKTIVALLLIMCLFVVFETKLVDSILPADWHVNIPMEWWHETGGARGNIRLGAGTAAALRILFSFTLPLLFWILAYFRLKEKEL